jgi:hypothetical protein
MEDVTGVVDVGWSEPGKAGANRPKECGTDHPAADFQISVTSPAGGEFASAGRTDESSASSNDF